MRLARWMTGIFIVGLVLSGLTAMPVQTQLELALPYFDQGTSPLTMWLHRVHAEVADINRTDPYIFYGYDWLAFGHIAIALAFVPAWRDPVRHAWLFTYGLTLCGLVVVWAVCVGPFRGIPWGWTLVDCAFGVLGAVPLLLARRAIRGAAPVSSQSRTLQ